MSKIDIKIVPVEIKVIRIDNHKMTKAVYRQIPPFIPFSLDIFDNPNYNILGWIYDESISTRKVVLIIHNSKLYLGDIRNSITYDYMSSEEYEKYLEKLDNYDQIYIAT